MKETTGEGGGRGGELNSLSALFFFVVVVVVAVGFFLTGCVVFLMTALCVQEWAWDNKAVCAVLPSDLLQFFLPLLLPCADMEGRRDREDWGGDTNKVSWGARKRNLVATWWMKESGMNTWYQKKKKKSNLWCLFPWSDVPMISSQKRQNQWLSLCEWCRVDLTSHVTFEIMLPSGERLKFWR